MEVFHHLRDDDDDDDDHDHDHDDDDDGFHCKIVGLRCSSNLTLRWLLSTLHPSIAGRAGAPVRIVFGPCGKLLFFKSSAPFFFHTRFSH